jgi:FecR-like protein
MQMLRPRSIVVGLVASLILAAWSSADAQMRPASAELVRSTGRVDLLPKGQSAWTAATVGARLVEGDQIRALAGGTAELNLPDGSTIVVAENTRFAVTKLDYDTATRDRDASFHVVAGKVRAQVSQAAVSLIRARQSNFNISTPNGVAAIRGTIVVTVYNPATQEAFTYVFPSPGQSPGSAHVTYIAKNGQTVTITGNNFVRQVGNNPPSAPQPVGSLPATVQAALLTAQNASTQNAGELITINVLLPTAQETGSIVTTGIGTTPTTTIIPVSTTPIGNTGGCNGCGQDVKNNPAPTPGPVVQCPPDTAPPCEPAGRGNSSGSSSKPRPPVCASQPCD